MSTQPQRRKKHKPQHKLHYTAWDVLLASDTAPMLERTRRHQLTRLNLALHDMANSPAPNLESWRTLSDCFNLLRTLVEGGSHPVIDHLGRTIGSHWPGANGLPVLISDSSGLLPDALQALEQAARRYQAGQNLRFSGNGLHAVRSLLADYSSALAELPQRTMLMCHRQTEKALAKVWHKAPPGVTVTSL